MPLPIPQQTASIFIISPDHSGPSDGNMENPRLEDSLRLLVRSSRNRLAVHQGKAVAAKDRDGAARVAVLRPLRLPDGGIGPLAGT